MRYGNTVPSVYYIAKYLLKYGGDIMGAIYKITNIINNKIYIGYTTVKFEVRMRKHKTDDIKYDTILGRAINKYGWENFKCEIITESSNKDELLSLEKYYIKYFNSKVPNGYNMTDGGEKLFGESNPFYNHRHSEETKNILSEKASLKVGDKNGFYGKHHNKDTKRKIAEANSVPIVAVDKNGNIIDEFSSQVSARDWCIEKGLTSSKNANSDISKRCKDSKMAFGYYWRYKNEGVETMPDECRAVG